jgi:SAM-dependent methyltransferase
MPRTGKTTAALAPADAPPCPLTGAPMRPWLCVPRDWRRPTAGGVPSGGWQLWWSDVGNLGMVHPRPAAAEIASFYELDDYYTHDRGQQRLDRPGLADRLRVALAARLDRGVHPGPDYWPRVVPKSARLGLEIGNGNGDRMVELAPLMDRIVGLEPDPRASATARSKGLHVLPGTAEAMPLEIAGQRYDFILFAHVLEHCLDPLLALQNAAELLAPNGVMLLETPNNAARGLAQQGRDWYWLDVPRHLNFFTEASLRAFAARAGLQVIACEYWGYCRQFLDDWLATQAAIAAHMADRARPTAEDLARQRRLGLSLLARTALAGRAAKYDSVRLICRRA